MGSFDGSVTSTVYGDNRYSSTLFHILFISFIVHVQWNLLSLISVQRDHLSLKSRPIINVI